MIKKGLVSIITPMYNSEKHIASMIESVQKQTYQNWELIIVDDCSSDNSCLIVEEYSCKDDRIRLIKKKVNSGPSDTRNVAIDNSSGQYLAFLDSDDEWLPEKLKFQIKAMKNKKSPISCTGYYINNEKNGKISEFQVKDTISYGDLQKKNYFSCDTVVIDRYLVMFEMKFREFPMHEDYILWLYIMKELQGKHALGINKPLAIYNIGKNSRSSNKFKGIYFIMKAHKINQNSVLISLKNTFFYITNGINKYYLNIGE